MKKFILFIFANAAIISTAQKNFTIEEAVAKSRTTLAPARARNLMFTKNAGQVSFVDASETLQFLDAKGKKSLGITLVDLNALIKKSGGEELKAFPAVKWVDGSNFTFITDKVKWNYNVAKKELKEVEKVTKSTAQAESLENVDMSPDGTTKAYTKGFNLYINSGSGEKAISTDGSLDLVYGQAAHRNEFGIDKGTFFSPKGTYLAFYRMDQSMVTSYPIIDWTVKPALNELIKYPFAGDKSHQVTLGVYNVKTGNIHYVKTTGDPEQYLTNIAFSEDESKIYIAIVNRAQNEMNLNEYETSTGNFVKTLFTEKDDKYIEPLLPMLFVKNNPSQFIWQSNRDGYKHLYLYDVSGKLIKQLTKGQWEIKQLNGFDATGANLFFHCNYTSPVNQDFCMINLRSGAMKVLTSGNGFHTAMLNEAGTHVIDNFSNITTPRKTFLIDVKTGKQSEVFSAPDPLQGYNIGKLKLFTIKNNENTDLYSRMFFPHDFDSTKKYPVVVYLYNGPHSQLVTNSWLAGADLWYHYMAQKGFIVFTLDGRGTDNRGKAFSQAIHRQIGTAEMDDQLSGVNYLKSLKYVDAARMGVHGWSYGGFMTTSLMTRNAGVFKAAVAGGPVIDWSYYEIMYGERYMDTPQENKDGYEKNNLLNHIGNLKGKLMVIHGTDDDVVVWQHSLMLLRKSVEKGVHLDYYVYPSHKHNVIGKDRVHLMDKISNYFIENL